MYPELVASASLPENVAKRPVLGFAEPPVSNFILRFAQSVRWVVFDNARLDGIREDAANKPHRSDRSARPAADDRLATQFVGHDGHPRLASDDVLHQIIHVRLGDVSHAPGSEKGNDVPPQTAHISCNGCFFFWAAAFAENEPSFHICDVLFAKLLDGERSSFFFTFFRRISAMRCPPE